MATLIAVIVVALILWQSQKAQRGRGAADLPPVPAADAGERPFPDAPRIIAPAGTSAASPVTVTPREPRPAGTAIRYAFASQPPPRRSDRTARIGRLARGKGLCSPRQ